MLHTFVPAEDFFADTGETFLTVDLSGKWLCVRKLGNDTVIERLISTDPFDFLSSDFEPGKLYRNKTHDNSLSLINRKGGRLS